jgi:hypothetical protein
MSKVYIKTDGDKNITELNSDIFLTDTSGWTQIDEGEGDKYAHAQGNYLPGQLIDDNGFYMYRCIGGQVVEVPESERVPEPVPEPPPSADDLIKIILGAN